MNNLKVDEYYHSELSSNVLEERDKYITERWDQLYAKLRDDFSQTINFLMIANLCGCLSVISVLGFSDNARQMPVFRWALLFFVLGVVFVGILRAIIVHRAAVFFNSWRKDVEMYHSEKMPFSEMTAKDDIRTRTSWGEFFIGYLSGVCFIIAGILSGICMFSI